MAIEPLSWTPRAFALRDALTPEECDVLLGLARASVRRSTVIDSVTGESKIDPIRTSKQTFLSRENEAVMALYERLSAVTLLPWTHNEDLQVLRYDVGEKYDAHEDVGEEGSVSGVELSREGGQRGATVLLYLEEPEEGGETAFPDAKPLPETKADFLAKKDTFSACGWNDGDGFSVKPKKGSAVLFFSFHINRTSDALAGHASCPTLRGTKFTATKWIHESPFSTGTYVTPTCEDVNTECAGWASVGECEKNPGFMMGIESVGACSKSCCARMDRSTLTEIQKTFCVPCDG